ncbi:hypothetical protein [Bacteroides oleiciplenus]|uniref:Uncharacterized protein n=1 Tax=Bacteroides oleiciplenus YIT 12058 TaxID=742727 RepID=K9EKK5_9BACE|nr:hypothetical protein [Bacteroides oleiciplenus]EKU91462.1 hypothetical protein HMPREF9447_01652 [Bacteroides oleiciplenus YIT 12058]
MTIETLFKNLKKAVAYQERENNSFYEELGMRIKGYFLNQTYHSCSSIELTYYAEMTMLKSYLACITKPSKESFTGLADAFLYDFIAFSVIPKDKEDKARLLFTSLDMCHRILGILTCLSPQDAKIAFECFLNVIEDEIEMGNGVRYKNTLFPEVFILYDLLTDNNSSALLNKYIGDTPMHSVYKNFLQLIDSDDEDSIDLAIDEMVDYHLMQCRNDTYQREFYSRAWRFIPVEIWAFLRLRVIRGKTISFVKNRMIKKSIPFLMQEKYELSQTAQSLKKVIYKNYISNKVEPTV